MSTKSKWIRVLSTGNFVGGNNVPISIDTARLDRIVSNYNTELCECPLVIGHPKTDDPAFGWVEKFKRVGDSLLALPKKVVAEFAEAVNDGRYQYVSCKVRPNDTIAHIGFLGAIAPSVKGLGVVTLSEQDDGVCCELSMSDVWSQKNLFRRMISFIQKMRDQVLADKGIEEADRLINNDEIQYMTQDIESLGQNDNTNAISTLSEEDEVSKELQAALDAANARVAELSEVNTGLSTKVSTLTVELEAIKKASVAADLAVRAAEFSEFCDDLIAKGKLAAGEKVATVTFMEAAFQQGDIELSEGDGTTKTTKSALDHLKSLLSLRAPSVLFGEHATRDNVGAASELSEADGLAVAIQKYQADEAATGRSVSVVDALAHVKKQRV